MAPVKKKKRIQQTCDSIPVSPLRPSFSHLRTCQSDAYLSGPASYGFFRQWDNTKSMNSVPCFSRPDSHGSAQTYNVPFHRRVELGQRLRMASDYFRVTPFGIYCYLCQEPVASKQRSMEHHIKSTHHEHLPPDIRSFLAKLSADQNTLIRSGNLYDYVVQTTIGYVCGTCGEVYAGNSSLRSHCTRKKTCLLETSRKTTIHYTTCGRLITPEKLVPKIILDDPSSISPDAALRFLQGLVRTDECAKKYAPHFVPFVKRYSSPEFQVKKLLDILQPMSEDEDMHNLLRAAENWLCEIAWLHTGMVPGNLRAALMVFEGNTVGDVSQNITFSFRRDAAKMLPELHSLLCFAWQHPRSNLKRILTTNAAGTEYFIPAILTELHLETVESLQEHPLIFEYCLVRAFFVSHDALAMRSCGQLASIAGTVLYLIRAGVCSSLVSIRGNDCSRLCEARVQSARDSVAANLISPLIRQMREMQSLKPNKRKVTVSSDRTIAVDGFEFPSAIWTELVPLIFEKCKEHIGTLFAKMRYETYLDERCTLSVTKSSNNEFVFLANESCGDDDFPLPDDVFLVTFDKLCSYVELFFHGCGGGSMRHEELRRMGKSYLRWHRNTIYFQSTPIKRFSAMISTSKTVERKLPPPLARVYLLYTLLTRHLGISSDIVIAERQGRTHFMKDSICELFFFKERPDDIQIRQFWCSVQNITFPQSSTENKFAAHGDVAELSGHSVTTHEQRYASMMMEGQEFFYRTYHSALGYTPTLRAVNVTLESADLDEALRFIYGPGASYQCDLQKKMVQCSSLELDSSVHVSLPCGAGKSLTWLVPVAASKIKNKELGMILVLLPYSFLVEYHYQRAKQCLARKLDVTVERVTCHDFADNELPRCLSDEDSLPDIVFLNLESFGKLTTSHKATLNRWSRDKRIFRVVIDEVHTVYGEVFRDSYSSLCSVGTLACPVLTLSGTLPLSFVRPLMKTLHLVSNDDGKITTVHRPDVVGEFPLGFSFQCNIVEDVVQSTVFVIKEKVLRKIDCHCVHVIVETKDIAAKIAEQCKLLAIPHQLAMSDTPKDTLQQIAAEWLTGDIDVLISTTIALVGNENPRCYSVIVAGYLFNIMSVAQAIGRLRPAQRRSDGSIHVFLPNRSERWFREQSVRDETRRCILTERGLLDSICVEYAQVCTIEGIRSWAIGEGCRLVNMARRFGYPRKQCSVCDRCRETTLAKASQLAAKNVRENSIVANRALPWLRRLEDCCLVCKSEKCNGEGCLGNKACFKCGSNKHYRADCRFDPAVALQGRACYFCFDVYSRQGYRNHDSSRCPAKRRLKRLFIEGHRRTGTGSFHDYLCHVAADEKSFCRFVTKICDDIAGVKK